MSYHDLGPARRQVLQRPEEGAPAVLDVRFDGHEHLVLVGGQALLVPVVGGVQQRARRRADAAPSAPYAVVHSTVPIHCCFGFLPGKKLLLPDVER
uniref:Uncharacterized protein n=1 Tax=Oryza brachyantha TaxID=4533 RepID=J3LFL5_ORYBR